MRVPRLLLVDDNRDNLEVLAIMLAETYSVSSCGSAAEALAVLDSVRPDLLVLDIGMAPVDGLQCLRAIRARPGYSRTPAIALTAFAREVERQRFLAAGFQAVVTKPILDHRSLEALIDTLARSAGSFVGAGDGKPAGNVWCNDAIASRHVLTGQSDESMISARGRREA